MKNRVFLGFTLFVLISCISFAGGSVSYKEGELLVRFAEAGYGLDSPNPTVQAAARQQVLDSAGGGTVVHLYKRIPGWALVKLPAGQCVESMLAQYASTPGIAYVEPNYKGRFFGIPNDMRFNELWAMRNTGQGGGTPGADISATDAWDIVTGNAGIVVAVIDSGVHYMHPDLNGNMWVNLPELNGTPDVDDDGNGYVDDIYGYDFAGAQENNPDDADADPCDVLGHGTHVAGTIGAVGNNAQGVTGVCWDVSLMALKIGADDSEGFFSIDDSVLAIEYAIDMGADVINASWGTEDFSLLLETAVAEAWNAGIIFVTSAGNGGDDQIGDNIDLFPVYPAAFPLDNIISVLATNNIDGRPVYSNYGLEDVDLGAPGGDYSHGGLAGTILSTVPGNDYDYNQGTSMAAPHVTGACALLLSYDPNLSYLQIKSLLINTADPLAALSGRCVSGGRLNIGAAIMEIAVDDEPPTPDPAQWASWGQPKATGLHTIAMEAKVAEDRGEVEYYFGCVTDSAFDSGWQSGTRYNATGLATATQYTFRVRARDDSNNMTAWSVQRSATTGSGDTDPLSPFPDPPVWQTEPYAFRLPPDLRIVMEAKKASDESGVQYWFEETSGTGYNSGWQSSSALNITSGPFVTGGVYEFRFKVRDMSANLNTTAYSSTKSLVLKLGPQTLPVPSHYPTIQDAIDAAKANDIVVVSPGTYFGDGNVDLHFDPNIPVTVRSIDPNDPAIVASTIIDCSGLTRGFNFVSGEGPNTIGPDTIVAGLTIRDGFNRGTDGTPGSPFIPGNPDQNEPNIPAVPAGPGSDGMGGGIVCIGGSSPTILKCILDGCSAVGGDGGEPNGAPGGPSGSGLGGGIYCDADSNPVIRDCEIRFCSVLNGIATDNFNFGGSFGGGIYVTYGSGASIEGCLINGCSALGVLGGLGSGGGIYHGLAPGPVSIVDTEVVGSAAGDLGGGIYFASLGNGAILTNCEIASNTSLGDGGGISYETGHTLQIEQGCRIYNNSCQNKGGGIFAGDIAQADATDVTIFDSSVSDNSAVFGGGIYMDETHLSITNSDVSNNSAEEGAGINGAYCDVNIISSTISDNSAATGAGIGGGMALWNTTGQIINCVMQGNNAAGTIGIGGAVYFDGFDTSPKQLVNCLITDNEVSKEGAGLFCHLGAWAELTNCTIAGNKVLGSGGSGGGISSAEFASMVELKNSIVYNNSAPHGPQIAAGRATGSVFDPYALVNVEYSDVQGGEDDVFEELPYAAVFFFEGNWDEDDPFVPTGASEPSYFLRHVATGQTADSVLVDNGTGDANDLAEQVGFDLTTRIDGVKDTGTVDIGYHYPAAEVVVPNYQLTIRVEHHPDYDANGILKAEGLGFEPFSARNEPSTTLVMAGVQVRLTAVADSGFKVSDWTGADDVPNTGDPCNIVTMDSDKEVTVSFDPDGAFYLYTDVPTNNGRIDYINSVGQKVEHPGRTLHEDGQVVHLFAVPEPNNPLQIPHWNGTDNDSSIERENTVTMNTNKYVTVSFIDAHILYVGQDSQYQTIQLAIDDAVPGDIVMISPGTYNIYEVSGHDHIELNDKDITITTRNPEDANLTVILGGFYISNVSRNTLIQGLTITGNYVYADRVHPQNPPGGYDGLPGAPQHGGGMRLHSLSYPTGNYWQPEKTDSASPIVRNCIFLNCRATGTNGRDGVAPTEQDYPVWGAGNGGWGSWVHGGAVSCGPDSDPLFIDCVFRGCAAVGGDAGAGANSDEFYPGFGGNWGNETLPDPTRPGTGPWDWGPFQPYWKYSGYGGAVYIDANCTAEFIRCSFIDNTVQGGSCGISGTGRNGAHFSGWPYQHYKIDRFGGAVYAVSNCAARFVDCNFINNLADPNEKATHRDGGQTVAVYPNLSYGGAVAFEEGADMTFERCNFADNTADVGAGVYFTWSDPYITDCNFTGNTANNGGGILCVGGSGLIENCRFTANSATIPGGFGGGIAVLGANTDIVGTEIIGNSSQGSGGGLYISNKDVEGAPITTWNEVSVKNCLIAENTAGSSGAGISSNWHSFAQIALCTIANNSVLQSGGYGGGLFSSNGNFAMVTNSILWGNAATNGRQIAIKPNINPAYVAVKYTDIRGGNTYTQPPDTGGNIWVDQGCVFNPGMGNIGADLEDDPLFVSGILGDYYLSQTATGAQGQTQDSPCVDAGSASSSSLGMDTSTTRTDEVPDWGKVDMGYHYPLSSLGARCKFCDIAHDGEIGFADFAAFAFRWFDQSCNGDNDWCDGADFNFDGAVDFRDVAYFGSCWLVVDNEPPVPDPMQWRITPRSTSSSSIFMGGKIAYDAWGGPVEYYFECSDANHNSTWQDDPNYDSSALVAGRQYSYRVMARDEWGNETQFSGFGTAVVAEDSTPPTPNPMTWAVLPAAISNTAITMVASVATDESGVEYGFRRLGGPEVWQDGPNFTDEGLEPSTEYTYQTAARDKSDNHNTAAWSVPASATTSETPTAPDTEPPITGVYANIYKAAFAVVPDEVWISGSGYHHQMTAVTATDDTPPVEYMFICYDESGFNSGWQTDPFYDVLVSSLQSKSYYKWRVITRDSVTPTPNYGVSSDYWNCRGESAPYP
jgi:subtilisin family serine protease